MELSPLARRMARSSFSASTSGSYVSNEGSFQYVSNVASNFLMSAGVETFDARMFHSSPSTRAAFERFDDPMMAVSYPEALLSSHA